MPRIRLTPYTRLCISFALVILAGYLMLGLPGVTVGEALTPIERLFTSVSATCVTGLIVLSTGHDFTLFGQAIILLLIQIGGLGFITLASSVLMQIRHKVTLSQVVYLRQSLGATVGEDLHDLFLRCMKLVFTIEGIGAALLFARFCWEVPAGSTWLRHAPTAAWQAVFHSISAFCNAGFSIWDDSLTRYTGDWWVNGVVMVLIILGGLGFFVLTDLEVWLRSLRRPVRYRIPFQTRVVLITSVALIVVGAALIWVGEHLNPGTLGGRSIAQQGLAALFHSVSARTAGFNTVDLRYFSNFTLAILMILMFIGASPGSAGGGIKVTTFAVLFTLATGAFRSGREPNFQHRSFGPITARSAIVVFFVGGALVVGGALFLLLVETAGTPLERARDAFIMLAFEAASAFGTVGLSTGITGHISTGGKLCLIVLMYLGRVGPLGLISATLRGGARPVIRYPSEDVQVG